ncbi:hypothetical protein M218_09025 [Burkholderia pseudomallei MSHR338]|nr:hypothetical protein M218_09025 [Burkholderia pseudomallei MSHR338]
MTPGARAMCVPAGRARVKVDRAPSIRRPAPARRSRA